MAFFVDKGTVRAVQGLGLVDMYVLLEYEFVLCL
jgi:hypothetical protein